MSVVQDVVRIAEHCAFHSQLPKRISRLVELFEELTHTQRCRARNKMKKRQLHERMARRATEIASIRLASAEHVIEAMSRIFGEQATIGYLRDQDYPAKLLRRSERHKKHGDDHNAEILREHVVKHFGGGEVFAFTEENRIPIHQEEPHDHQPSRRPRLGFATHC